jgi:hypothetical protein
MIWNYAYRLFRWIRLVLRINITIPIDTKQGIIFLLETGNKCYFNAFLRPMYFSFQVAILVLFQNKLITIHSSFDETFSFSETWNDNSF